MFLDSLLSTTSECLSELLALSPVIDAARKQVTAADGTELSGWSTDRAASATRIESWVSMDVLLFAVQARRLAQEVGQYLVSQKYGAVEISDQPAWPYKPDATTLTPSVGRGHMRDADLGDPAWNLSPVQILHERVVMQLQRKPEDWKLPVSSLLLFGPPGTAKSTVAKSLAQHLRWHFLELTPSNFIDQGLEMIEQRSREVFAELSSLRETVILFDELDSLLTDRERLDPASILNFTVPAMLPKLQGLTKSAKRHRTIVIFATNFYDRLDPAMVRRGRIDERLVMLPHTRSARVATIADFLMDVDPARLNGAPANLAAAADRAAESTPLAVWEDLKRYCDDWIAGQLSSDPYTGISPTLYASRLPAQADQAAKMRSTERLAIEVAEVVGRLVGDDRRLGSDSDHDAVVNRLTELRSDLGGHLPW